jgi:hypothetical protein
MPLVVDPCGGFEPCLKTFAEKHLMTRNTGRDESIASSPVAIGLPGELREVHLVVWMAVVAGGYQTGDPYERPKPTT